MPDQAIAGGWGHGYADHLSGNMRCQRAGHKGNEIGQILRAGQAECGALLDLLEQLPGKATRHHLIIVAGVADERGAHGIHPDLIAAHLASKAAQEHARAGQRPAVDGFAARWM